jgi:hypothetical protein
MTGRHVAGKTSSTVTNGELPADADLDANPPLPDPGPYGGNEEADEPEQQPGVGG